MHIDFDAFPNALGLTTAEQRQPYAEATKRIVREYEIGMMDTNAFLTAMESVFEQRFIRQQILDAFNAIIVRDNEQIVPFVDAVSAEHRIAILSNTCACHWEKVLRVSSLVHRIPHHFSSFALGMMKPDVHIYHRVCESLNVQPQDVLFIDDLQENVDGARAAGMNTIHFLSARQLVGDFSAQRWS